MKHSLFAVRFTPPAAAAGSTFAARLLDARRSAFAARTELARFAFIEVSRAERRAAGTDAVALFQATAAEPAIQ